MKFFLIVAKGIKSGMPIPIEIDLFQIGQDKNCQLRATHPKIGLQHCAILTRQKKVFLRDYDSGEATTINGEIMPSDAEFPLHAGDMIEVGPLKFMIQFREKPLSQRDLEEWALRCLDQDETRKVGALDTLDRMEALGTEDSASGVAGAILERLSAKKGIVKGRLRISREGNLVVCRLNDVHLVEDAELALIKKELHENLSRPNLRVVLDLKNVRRMSSTAAEMFAELSQWLRPQGSKMAICRMRSDMQGMLKAFPATRNLPVFHDKDAASAGKW